MRQYINPHTIANEARMGSPRDKSKTRVFVEGSTDSRVLVKFFSESACMLIPSLGKDNAIGALLILRKARWKGVAAVVDRDFESFMPALGDDSDIFLTDTHDIETMLLRSPALEAFLRSYGLNIEDISDTLNRVFEAARVVGYLRWISIRDNLKLNFDDMRFDDFIDVGSLLLRVEPCIAAILANSRSAATPDLILTHLSDLQDPSHDKWQLCCGHDLIEILTFALLGSFGLRIRCEQVFAGLCDGYWAHEFQATALYGSIVRWQTTNRPYQILAT